MGGTAYFIVDKDGKGRSANLLVDTPANEPDVLQFIADRGGVRFWIITHRGAIGAVKALQTNLQCQILVQEQEAYLLPGIPNVITYREYFSLGIQGEVLWMPGHSPGSACVYYKNHGGILFSGRHLLPDRQGQLRPLRFSKTFHWPRQLQNVEKLQTRFSADTLSYICPGANTGFLRGEYVVANAYPQLQNIDVVQLLSVPALL